MPGINKYEGKIPTFYRRRAMELIMFAHVTAMYERKGMTLDEAIKDFQKSFDKAYLSL